MPITATEAARTRIAHLDGVGRIFLTLSQRGSSTPAADIRTYQRGWNSRWRTVQEALALQGQTALANTLRELAEDGRWGTNTAYTTALWISATPPPSSAGAFRAWWQANGSAIRSRVEAAYRQDRAVIDAAESPQTPPAPPVMPMAVDAEPTISDPSSSIEERWERDSVATSTSTRAGGRSGGGGGAALGLLAVVGIGYWALKSGVFNGVESVDFMGADEGEDCGCDG